MRQESPAYYDSTLSNIKNNKKLFRKISKRRASLEDVIYYELSIKTSDSILNLVKMSEEERIVFFNNHLDILKEKLKKEEKAVDNKNKNIFSVSKQNELKGATALFYFYKGVSNVKK